MRGRERKTAPRAARAEIDRRVKNGDGRVELRRRAVDHAAGAQRACAARLAPVKTIGAAFRVSGKALPTAPSFFVAEILGPLRDFLGTHTSELELSGEAPAAGWRAAEWAALAGSLGLFMVWRVKTRVGWG